MAMRVVGDKEGKAIKMALVRKYVGIPIFPRDKGVRIGLESLCRDPKFQFGNPHNDRPLVKILCHHGENVVPPWWHFQKFKTTQLNAATVC